MKGITNSNAIIGFEIDLLKWVYWYKKRNNKIGVDNEPINESEHQKISPFNDLLRLSNKLVKFQNDTEKKRSAKKL